MKKTEFNGKIQIDKVVIFLNDFKKTLYDVNYINKLISQNANDIIINNYNSVIRPFIDKKYINFVNNSNDNINRHDFYIGSLTTIIDDYEKNCNYYASRFPQRENILFSNKLFWENLMPNSDDYFLVNGANINIYEIAKSSTLSVINYLNKCLSLNPNLSYMYQLDIREDPDGVVLVIRCIRRDILYENDNTKWICISSSMKLMPYFDNAQTMSSLEYLPNIIPIFNSLLIKLESSQWSDTSLIKNIWEYSNISNIANTKCLYSKKYPNWNGKLISDCFIPNSNINVQSNMEQLFNDLYFYYPSLTVGEIAFSTRNINGTNLLSICKIDMYTDSDGIDKQCIKEVQLNLDKFFQKNNIIGDTILNGGLNITDGNGDSVLQTDNVTKNISIHGKVGINQDLHEIKGLLDIDNLSVSKIYKIVDKIAIISNATYNVVDEVKDSILNTGTFNISENYTNEIIIFKVPIKIKIEKNDISFLYKPSNIFKTSQFLNESFLKIQLIVNEINRMSFEIDNYYKEEGDNLIMSFIELLNDTEYYYVCSLKAIFKDSDIYFVMSFTSVQDIMIDKSYTNIFTNFINYISSGNRALNYSILLVEMPEIYNKLLTTKDSVNSFTKYFQESEFSDRFGGNDIYHYCFTYTTTESVEKRNLGRFLFHEVNTYFNGNKLNEVYIPGTDKTDGTTGITVMRDYANYYGQNKYGQNFCIRCTYSGGSHVDVINKIIIKGTEYVIGSGISISSFLNKTIISKGDNSFTGDLLIQDVDYKTIFEVNTEQQKITNMYKTGFGTEYPKTIIDINDSGLTDIINIIKDMANREHTLNLNIVFIKNLGTINANDVDNCINTQFIDPNNTIGYQQSKDDYFYCDICNVDDNINKIQNIYTWLYRNWDDTIINNLNDKNNEAILNNYVNNLLTDNKINYYFDNRQIMRVIDWTFGKKICINRLFNKNDKQYIFGNGINIGNYNLKINNNGNISTFFDYVSYMNLYLQDFIIRLNTIDTTSIPNYKSVNDHFSIISNVISPKQFTLKKIVVDFSNYRNTKVYDIDFNTLIVSGNDSNKNIYEISDINARSKYTTMIINIKSIYSKNNTNQQLFNEGDYGVINLEDKFVDFISLFYCSEITSNSVTLISIEIQISTIIQPSVDIKGDLRIKGDTYFHNDNTNVDFVSIDTNESFVGIGTNERYSNYNTTYITTTNGDLTKEHCSVLNNKYPVFISTRISEIIPTRDQNYNIIDYPSDKLVLFSNKTSITARRRSEYYTIDELKSNAALYNEIAISGPYVGQELKYRYGPDINFEIQDSTQITHEMGNIHMVIDDIDENNKIKAGFGVSVVDSTSTGTVIEREIMYINNNGIMNVDKITLGMDTNTTNNVLLSASNNDLYVNDTSLQTIINNEIQKMFSVDPTSGNLNITYNGNTYVCNKI